MSDLGTKIMLAAALAVAGVLGGAGSAAQNRDRAEIALKAAIDKEVVEGDLKGAIEQYRKIVANYGGNRTVVAKALVRMGNCHEKLGDAEARKAYERVLRDYADQRETAAEARDRLAALSQAAVAPSRSAMAARQVWAEASVNAISGALFAAVSPDGRDLAYVDWGTGDLTLRELATGEKRNLTKNFWSSREFAMLCTVSPDGKRIAYAWLNKDILYGLRVIGLDGSGSRVLHRGTQEVTYLEPKAWSPDGKQILANFYRADGTNQIVMVDAAEGGVRVLKSLPSGPLGRMSFSPDGRHIVYDFPPLGGSRARDIFLLSTDASPEIPLVQHAADDFVLGWAPGGKHVLFASDRTGTLDAWIIPVTDGNPLGPPEQIRQGLGRIQPIGFAGDGSYYYGLRTGMRDVQVAEMDLESGKVLVRPAPAAQQFVGANISPDWSADGQFLAYLSKRDAALNSVGCRVLCIRSLKTGEVREFSPGLNAMYRLRWFPDGRSLYVINFGSSDLPDLYRVDAVTGKATVVHRNVAETAFSPDGRMVFYWRYDPADKQYPIFARDLETGQEKQLYRGPQLRSMTLSPDARHLAFIGREPQAGASPALKVMPITGGAPRTLIEGMGWLGPAAWTPDSRQLIFTKGAELWRISVEGGSPHKLGPAMEQLSDLRIHPDGRRIAFVAGRHKAEVWVMENFLPESRAGR
jgi:Tol biopolymer transport system component